MPVRGEHRVDYGRVVARGERLAVAGAEMSRNGDAECEVARVYGWNLDDLHHTTLLGISVAFGCARFGGWEERFLVPALSAISSAAYPRMARLLEPRLVEAPPSSGRDQLRAALQHAASR